MSKGDAVKENYYTASIFLSFSKFDNSRDIINYEVVEIHY
jgi:hypothetical protein